MVLPWKITVKGAPQGRWRGGCGAGVSAAGSRAGGGRDRRSAPGL